MRLISSPRARRGPGRPGGGTLALDDVSLDVAEGESFGIIGPNGAGKTTLLKLISRISYPTGGRLRVRGRVSALIDVAAGVHPELTGRENVSLYGRILGMPRSHVRSHFEQIVEFAELGHVLDMPVKFYSAGMQVRLGFSIAAHLEPDIFVVDEALAVGDEGFQAKCVQRMSQLVTEGRTLIFVSHFLPAVEAICSRALFLQAGRTAAIGPTSEVLSAYLDWVEQISHAKSDGGELSTRYLTLEDVGFYSSDGSRRTAICTGEDVEVRLQFRASAAITEPYVSIGLSDYRVGNVILCSMLVDGGAPQEVGGRFVVSCRMRQVPLLPRLYEVRAEVATREAFEYFDWQPVATLKVSQTNTPSLGPASQSNLAREGPVYVPHEWVVTREG